MMKQGVISIRTILVNYYDTQFIVAFISFCFEQMDDKMTTCILLLRLTSTITCWDILRSKFVWSIHDHKTDVNMD